LLSAIGLGVESLLDFIPVDMLDLRTNQLEKNDEKETVFRGTDYPHTVVSHKFTNNTK
jgi:hypothetical protein